MADSDLVGWNEVAPRESSPAQRGGGPPKAVEGARAERTLLGYAARRPRPLHRYAVPLPRCAGEEDGGMRCA